MTAPAVPVVAADLAGLLGRQGGRRVTVNKSVSTTIGVPRPVGAGFCLLRRTDVTGDELDLLINGVEVAEQLRDDLNTLIDWARTARQVDAPATLRVMHDAG